MFKKKFRVIALMLCIVLMMGFFVVNTEAVSTVLLAVQGAIVDGNLVKFKGINGIGEDTGLAATNVVKSKFDATSAPTVNNDTDEGYTVGSRWLDVTNDKSYVCLDNTDGAAVWHLDFEGPGSSTDHAIVRWDGTTGRTVLNSVVTVSDAGVIAGGEWQGTVIGPAYGGTGVANAAASTITISGNFATTITVTNVTTVTLPTSGTLVNTAVTTLSSLVSVGTITTGGLGTGAVIGGVTMTLGSDADYDIYYRASSILTRLAPNTVASNKFLRMIGTGAAGQAPSWEIPSSDDLSDVASIAMLDENETVTGNWEFQGDFKYARYGDEVGDYPVNLFVRGRDGDPTYVPSEGDIIGSIWFSAILNEIGGSAPVAKIEAVADGAQVVGLPGRLDFYTDNGTSTVLRMAIDHDGNIKMGDGAWSNYINVTSGGVMTAEGTASITATNLVPIGEIDFGAHSAGFTLQTATGDGATLIDWTLGNKFKFTFGAQDETITFTNPTNPGAVQMIIVQDGVGGRSIIWSGIPIKWAGGVEPTLSIAGGAEDVVSFIWDGTSYYGFAGFGFAVP